MSHDVCEPPTLKRVWDQDSLAQLRVAWEAGGVNAAHQAFPSKSKKSLEQAAYSHGIRRLSSPARKMQEAVQARAPMMHSAMDEQQDGSLEKRLSAIEKRLATLESALRREPVKATPEPAKADAAPGMTLASVKSRPESIPPVLSQVPPVLSPIPPHSASFEPVAESPPENPEAKQQAGRLDPIKPGPCDPGDREFIRRRMDFVIFQLSADLRRSQASIREAIADLAKGDYEPKGVARLSVPREEAEASI